MIKVLKENKNLPMEGFFWIINDKVIGYAKEVPQYNYSYSFEGKTHKNTWINFSKDYLVDNKEVSFDYFPRGRVMVDPNYDKENNAYKSKFLEKCFGEVKKEEDKNKKKRLVKYFIYTSLLL